MLLVYNCTDSATWNASSSTRNEQLILLRENCKEIMERKCSLRFKCPESFVLEKEVHIPVPSLASRKRRNSVILHGFEKTRNKIRKVKNTPENIVCTPQLPSTPCIMQCIPSIPAIGLLSLTGAENKHTKPWNRQRHFLFFLFKNQNAQNMQGGKIIEELVF